MRKTRQYPTFDLVTGEVTYPEHKYIYTKTKWQKWGHPAKSKFDKFLRDPRKNIYKPQTIRRIQTKIYTFCEGKNMFTFAELLEKLGPNPRCYLSGEPINLKNTTSYQFDHKLPRSKGGPNTLENLGICTTEINEAKRDKLPQQFIEMCRKVAKHNPE